jgi:hypothetical protein
VQQTQELVDTYFRLAADFDNFRKRAEGNLVQAKVRLGFRVCLGLESGASRGAWCVALRRAICDCFMIGAEGERETHIYTQHASRCGLCMCAHESVPAQVRLCIQGEEGRDAELGARGWVPIRETAGDRVCRRLRPGRARTHREGGRERRRNTRQADHGTTAPRHGN